MAEDRLGRILTVALLVSLATGCIRRTPDPTAGSSTSTSTATATQGVATKQVPTAVPMDGCTETTGSLQAGAYRGIAVAQDIPYNLYLPPCYDAHDQYYPTLYLLHGYPYDEAHWQNLGAIEIADDGIETGEWPPFIMVMPLQPEPLFRSSDGGPGSYETELLEGLVPFIEKNFRSDPSARALAGISRGGVWALEVAFRNPQEFDSVAALSPALAVNSARPPYDPFEIVADMDRFPRKILLLAGDEDWAAVETKRLSQVLSEAEVEHMFRISAGDHSDEMWAAVLTEVLRFLALGAGP
ncbi:MAG: alpha/beta hydrolase [Anaerolineales bacterium]